MSFAFHRSIWVALHFVVGLYNLLNILVIYSSYRIVNFINSFINIGANDEIHFLEQCRGDLVKLPRHLNVIIGMNCIDAEILSRITVYALISGIDYISFYDVKGNLTLDSVNIPKYVEARKMSNGRFLWSMSSGRRKSAGQLRYKNGLEKSIEVVVLSPRDNKPLLAEVCRDLRSNGHRHSELDSSSSCSDKMAASITTALSKHLGNLPEPELGIIFSKTMCTFGVLPWHTRFTEFHCIRNGNVFDAKTFASVLYKFSKCEQRFGK